METNVIVNRDYQDNLKIAKNDIKRKEYIADYFVKNPDRTKVNEDYLYDVARSLGFISNNYPSLKIRCHTLVSNILEEILGDKK